MNKLIYWKIRRKILNIIFKCKRKMHSFFDSVDITKENKTIKMLIIKRTVGGIIKGVLLTAILLFVDGFFLKKCALSSTERNYFVQLIIGGIGVSGVIFGLYCSNISSIYSKKYDNAPERVSRAFVNDPLMKRCIVYIVDYISFGFIMLIGILANFDISWVSISIVVFRTLVVVITYGFMGNRSYQLANIYDSGNGVFDSLNRVIKRFDDNLFVSDISFQQSYKANAQAMIDVLIDVKEYAHRKNSDSLSQTRFTKETLNTIENYWKTKRTISIKSAWFLTKAKYPKWHSSSDIEISMAIRTGTSLRIGIDSDYWWFEDRLLHINYSCLIDLLANKNYSLLNDYLDAFDDVCKTAVGCRETRKYTEHMDDIISLVKEYMVNESDSKELRDTFAVTVDKIVLFCTGIIIKSIEEYNNYDERIIINKVKESIDSGKSIEKLPFIRGRHHRDIYERIIKEVKVEGARITPDWLLEQYVAEEEYIELINLLEVIKECINSIFELGKFFYEKEMYFESCIILSRFYEYNSKVSKLLEVADSLEIKLKQYKIDSSAEWKEEITNDLKEAKAVWESEVSKLFAECSSRFAVSNWEKREDYPDFLGECFYQTCQETIRSIMDNNLERFKVNFDSLSKLMLIYQDYIRIDLLREKPSHDKVNIYYSMTFPIVEWAQIGGLAILWGDINSNNKWKELVDSIIQNYLKDDLAGKLVELIQDRDKAMFGLGKGKILDTMWTQSILSAITELDFCEYNGMEYEIKTDSKLFKIFCDIDLKFGFVKNPSEILWVLCVNPLLLDEKKYKSSDSWEEKLNDEDDSKME